MCIFSKVCKCLSNYQVLSFKYGIKGKRKLRNWVLSFDYSEENIIYFAGYNSGLCNVLPPSLNWMMKNISWFMCFLFSDIVVALVEWENINAQQIQSSSSLSDFSSMRIPVSESPASLANVKFISALACYILSSLSCSLGPSLKCSSSPSNTQLNTPEQGSVLSFHLMLFNQDLLFFYRSVSLLVIVYIWVFSNRFYIFCTLVRLLGLVLYIQINVFFDLNVEIYGIIFFSYFVFLCRQIFILLFLKILWIFSIDDYVLLFVFLSLPVCDFLVVGSQRIIQIPLAWLLRVSIRKLRQV